MKKHKMAQENNNLAFFKIAQNLNNEFKTLLIKEKVHFRGSSNSLSLISMSPNNPQLGVSCNANRYNSQFSNGLHRDVSNMIIRDIHRINTAPERSTPEKLLQSSIIYSCFDNDYKMPFDSNIRLITDELALKKNKGKIVLDLLGYTVTGDEIQLCLIELKSNRFLSQLIRQVENFEKIIRSDFDFFRNLMSTLNLTNEKRLSTELIKIIVWPSASTSPLSHLQDRGITEVTYQNSEDRYDSVLFNNYGCIPAFKVI